jgi:ribosome-binding factor A
MEHRRDRVAHLIRAELAGLLLREARDPRLQAVTITDVRVTADLRLARIQFRTLTAEATPREAEAALRRATPFLRGALGRALGMRVTPELRFEYDTTPDTARRVDALLDEVRGAGTGEDDEDES